VTHDKASIDKRINVSPESRPAKAILLCGRAEREEEGPLAPALKGHAKEEHLCAGRQVLERFAQEQAVPDLDKATFFAVCPLG
jgi:hypothetical protein